MPRFNHPILQEVSALNLPRPEEVVLNHGSALVIRGLRDEHSDGGDIDILTSWENVDYLRSQLAWIAVDLVVGHSREGIPRIITSTRDSVENHRFDVHRWDYSPECYQRTGRGRIYLEEQISFSEQDKETGIWVAKLELVRMTKNGSLRQKDLDDIALIDAHQES